MVGGLPGVNRAPNSWEMPSNCESRGRAKELGEKCAHILAGSRGSIDFDILILGGIKTTPATSNSPDALQANQWGVDVVETKSGEQFLRSINWAGTIATKDTDSIFSVELIHG